MTTSAVLPVAEFDQHTQPKDDIKHAVKNQDENSDDPTNVFQEIVNDESSDAITTTATATVVARKMDEETSVTTTEKIRKSAIRADASARSKQHFVKPIVDKDVDRSTTAAKKKTSIARKTTDELLSKTSKKVVVKPKKIKEPIAAAAADDDDVSATATTTTTASVANRKPHRWRPGTEALREIRRAQKSTDYMVPKAPFVRLVRSILNQPSSHSDMRLTRHAVDALREASESHLVELFAKAQTAAIHAGRITLFPKDFEFLQKLGIFQSK